jgi:diguanylate cyclase (GGDEF)-like protein
MRRSSWAPLIAMAEVPPSHAAAPARIAPGALNALFWPVVLIGALGTVALLIALFEWQGRSLIVRDQERSTQHLVRMMGNMVWPHHGSFIHDADELDTESLRNHPAQTDLLDVVRGMVTGSNVVKVKIFSPKDGRTIFSTDPKQVGSKHPGSAFDKAMRGELAGELSHRDEFKGLEKNLKEADIYATYLPYRRSGSNQGPVDAVLEIYSDVTERMATHRENRVGLALGVLLSLSLTYGVIYFLSRRANKALRLAQRSKEAQERQLRHQAFHDALTGLPNRTRFSEFCARTASEKRQRQYGVLSIDLDRFKMVNDGLGQRVGDAVLREVARRLKKSLRDTDKVFRLGGDEFIALVASDSVATLDMAAQRILAAMGKRVVVDGVEVLLTASVGTARWPKDAATLEEAVACADLAMSAAKRSGVGQLTRYRPEMKRALDDEVSLLAGLRQGLPNQEFVLHYQPRLSCRTGAIESVEALLRWNHPTLGMLPPGRFIGILENSSLIHEVGAWVLDTAARQVAQWRSDGHKDLSVSVNVAARQFRDKGLLATLQKVLNSSGLPAHALELEITEGQIIGDFEEGAATVERMKSLGVQVAIDDFGTGYSSLAYLQKLPIDCIKIDRAFVKDLGEGQKGGSIARAIASMAHSLDLKVVAEGVETQMQADILAGIGCEQLQGYLFSKPLPAGQMQLLLQAQTGRMARAEAVATRPMPLSASALVLS